METITISKQEYEELLRKVKQLEEQRSNLSSEEINSIENLPRDIRKDMDLLEKASDEDLATFERRNNL